MYACEKGSYDIVNLLVKDPRVDQDIEADNGQTAKIIAISNKHSHLLELLE